MRIGLGRGRGGGEGREVGERGGELWEGVLGREGGYIRGRGLPVRERGGLVQDGSEEGTIDRRHLASSDKLPL